MIDVLGLNFVPRRTHDGDGHRSWTSLNLASYHRRDSITWRWVLGWTTAWRFSLHAYSPPSGYGSAHVAVPLLGALHFSWQPHMAWPKRVAIPDHMPEEWCRP